jgi:hypothetical protein
MVVEMIFVTLNRVVTIGLMYSIVVVLCLFLGFKVLKRGKAITNKYMGIFFLWMGFTMSLKVLYVALDIAELIAILANIVGASVIFAQVFLLLFILIIRYSQAEINKQKQILWIVIAALISIGAFLIGSLGVGAGVGHTVPLDPAKDDVVPVWTWYYSLYTFIAAGIFILLTINNAYRARKGFTDVTMRKRFTYFLIGICLLFWLFGGNPWANLEAVSTFRTAFGISALVIVPAAILLYLSLGKEVSKKE